MVTNRVPTKTWVARDGQLYIDYAANITFGEATSLSGSYASTGNSITAAVKNITITPPETTWEKQDFIGQTSGKFQNALLDQKPVGVATLTATMILGELETIEDMISGVNVAAPSGYTRRRFGDDQTTTTDVAVCVTLQGPTTSYETSFALDDAKFTKWGDVRISGPDGHWEQDFTIICLPNDFYYEFKD